MQTKICTGCGAEYFAHVDECIDCHLPLKLPEELEAEKSQEAEGEASDMSPIREGAGPWLKELREVLKDKGIYSCISLSPGCKPGACGSSSLLFVANSDLAKADVVLNEHYIKTHPEALESINVDDDSCPACGHPAGADARECPDCGLALSFEDDS